MSETDLDTQAAAPTKEAETKAQTPWESMDPEGAEEVMKAGKPASPAVQVSLPAQEDAPRTAPAKKASPFASTAIVAVGTEMQQLAAELQSLMAENRFNPFEAMIASPLEKPEDHLLGKAFLSGDKIEAFEESFAGAVVPTMPAETVEPPAAPQSSSVVAAPATDEAEEKQDEVAPARPRKSRKKARRPKAVIATLKQAAISAVSNVVARLTHDGPVWTESPSRLEREKVRRVDLTTASGTKGIQAGLALRTDAPEVVRGTDPTAASDATGVQGPSALRTDAPEVLRGADPTIASDATEVHVGSALRTETPEVVRGADSTVASDATGVQLGSALRTEMPGTVDTATEVERAALEHTPWATIDEMPVESVLTAPISDSVESTNTVQQESPAIVVVAAPLSDEIPVDIEPLPSLADEVDASLALPAIDETAMADFSALPTSALTFDGNSALDPLEPGTPIESGIQANEELAASVSEDSTADFDSLPSITDEVEPDIAMTAAEKTPEASSASLPAPTTTFAGTLPTDSLETGIAVEDDTPALEEITAAQHEAAPLDVDDPPFVAGEVEPAVILPTIEQPMASHADAPSTSTVTFSGTSEPTESAVTFSTTAPEVFEVTPPAGFVASVEDETAEDPLDEPVLVHDDEAEYVATVDDAVAQPQVDAEPQVEVEVAEAPAPAVTGSGWTIPVMCLGLGLIACCLTIPQLDLNRRLRYEQYNLQTNLDTVDKQVAVNDEFLKKVMDDPTLAERLAGRQMLTIRKGQKVVPIKQISDDSEMSPFALVAVAPPPAPPPYAPIRGTIADICNNAHSRLYLLGSAMVMVAVGLVIGCGPRGKEGLAD